MPADLTPCERAGPYWIKRDDLYALGDLRGAKVRAALRIVEDRQARGLVTACSRDAQLGARVAAVAAHVGIPAEVHTAAGQETPPLRLCRRLGASVIAHRPGYMSVLQRRARDAAERLGYEFVRLGVESPEAVAAAAEQTANIPAECKRLVLAVGSGVTLAGVLRGLAARGRDALPVFGLLVGMDPEPALRRNHPTWLERLHLTTERAALRFEQRAPSTEFYGRLLDPHYEAKCLPYLRPDDCLWVVSGSSDEL